jgi:hypothetical protein
MVEIDYKVEMKGSLFEVMFENGCYSDYVCKYHLFSGNDENEVWELIKVWASQSGADFGAGFRWNDRCYQYKPIDASWRPIDKQIITNWDHDYGEVWRLTISRANVIYVQPKALLSDTIIVTKE